MKRLIVPVWIALFLFCSLGAHAEGVKLAYKFKAGEIDKYKISMKLNMNMAGVPQMAEMPSVDLSIVMKQKTLGVYPDGSAKVMISCSEPKVSAKGLPNLPKQKIPSNLGSIVVVLDPGGNIVKVEGIEKMFAFKGGKMPGLGNMNFAQLNSFMGGSAMFPSEEIEVGQSWGKPIPLPFGGNQLNVLSTLLSKNVAVGKRIAAKVEQTVDGSIDLGSMMKSAMDSLPLEGQMKQILSSISGNLDMFGTMSYYFSPSEGKTLRGDGELIATLKMGLPEQLVKMGAPSQLDMNLNVKVNMMKL